MKCPTCGSKSEVVETRNGRRRRKCLSCHERFTTEERVIDYTPRPRGRPKATDPRAAQAAARRRLEDMRDLSFLDEDDPFDYIPETW